MIKTKTVFILGAGASAPYNFPTGDGLKDKICQHFINQYHKLPILDEKDAEIAEMMRNDRKQASKKFTSALRRATGQSIDLFLKLNTSHFEIGKIAILINILSAENSSDIRIKKKNWYTYLFKRMMIECWKQKRPELLLNNNVKFITFNYDRSLEHFFEESFINNFSDLQNHVKLWDYVNKIPIHHVYGSVGKLPWQTLKNETEVVSYGNLDYRYVQTKPALKSIKLIDERGKPDDKKMIELFGNVEHIFILGFGFLEENLEVLNLERCLPQNQAIYIYATTKGIHPRRISELANYFNSFNQTLNVKFEPFTCYDMVYKYLWE